MKRERVKRIELMLDSGAFSAWNRGLSIDVQDYIKYIKEHEELFFSYVTLDVLPEGAERRRTPEAIEKSACESDINHQTMKDAGLSPIPVFHQGENFRWLENMLKNGEKYIGISTRKDLTYKQTMKWLDQVWSILSDDKGNPLVYTHGFGVTAINLLTRYPWYTVDSTTWSLTPAYGQILVPRLVGARWSEQDCEWLGGEWDYTHHPIRITTSYIQQGSESLQRKQFGNQKPMIQEHVRRFLQEEVGVSITEVRNTADARRRAVLIYYMKFMESKLKVKFSHHISMTDKSIITNKDARKMVGSGSVDIDFVKVMFATSLNKQFSNILTSSNSYTRLLSYFELRDKDPEILYRYVETGMPSKYDSRIPKQKWDNETYLTYRKMELYHRSCRYDSMRDDIYIGPELVSEFPADEHIREIG